MKFETLVLLGTAGLLALASTLSVASDERKGRTGPYNTSSVSSGNGLDNADWAEVEVPPPPAFSADHLIPLDMPLYVAVKVGVDPDSIVVSADGVVRYVIVMRNATGNTTAVYEGLRCASDEVKTYARQGSSGQWSFVKTAQWKSVSDNMPSRHAQAFARQGACQNQLATSKEEIIKALKTGNRPTQNNKPN